MDRYDLFDLCVAEAERLMPFVYAVHGRSPRVLREDFAGSASLARQWSSSVKGGRAIAVDRDAEPLERAQATVQCVVSDVIKCRERADVVAWTNFCVGELHTRQELLKHLRHARRCLLPGGALVMDIYGGSHAMERGLHLRELRGPSGEFITYTFEQRHTNAFTGRVVNALHFKVQPKGSPRAKHFRDAFVYDWRLWSIPELADAVLEAGFPSSEVHDRAGVAMDHRGKIRKTAAPAPDSDDWVAFVVARA